MPCYLKSYLNLLDGQTHFYNLTQIATVTENILNTVQNMLSLLVDINYYLLAELFLVVCQWLQFQMVSFQLAKHGFSSCERLFNCKDNIFSSLFAHANLKVFYVIKGCLLHTCRKQVETVSKSIGNATNRKCLS